MLVVAGPGTAQRAIEQLRDADVPAKLVEQLTAAPEPGLVTVTCGCLTEGLTTGGGLVLLTEADVTGNRGAATTDSRTLGSKRRRNAVDLVTLAARRLRRPRPARHRPLRRDARAHGQRRDPRVPRARVRVVEAGPARRPAVRPDGRPGRGQPLRRRRGTHAQQARRRRLGQDEGPRPQGGPRDRRAARAALRRPPVRARARLRARHALAARAGGRLPVHRDPGPALGDRRGQGGHGAARCRWTG